MSVLSGSEIIVTMSTILITALLTCPYVIIFSAINKTETKGRNIVNFINQRSSFTKNALFITLVKSFNLY